MPGPIESHPSPVKHGSDAIRIGLPSPARIRDWSFGEVTKADTINYRTLTPTPSGLFCTAIFGPVEDWECLCDSSALGKRTLGNRRGSVCKKCSTEITFRRVLRERHGHIELVAPCAHFRHIGMSSGHIGHVLDMSNRDLKRVLYYQAYVVVNSDAPHRLPEGAVLSEAEKWRLDAADRAFTALMGGEGIPVSATERADEGRARVPQAAQACS